MHASEAFSARFEPNSDGSWPKESWVPHLRILEASQDASVVFVDLDGTLLRTDTLWEAVLALARTKPWHLLLIPFWLLRGRVFFKNRLAELVDLDEAKLPIRDSVLEFVENEKRNGAIVVLATATARRWAEQIARRVGCFDHVIASDHLVNLKGAKKLEAIQAFCSQNDFLEFTYIGDSPADIPIWHKAARSVMVNPIEKIERRIRFFHANQDPPTVIRDQKNLIIQIARAIRVQQWGKNLLMFVPLILAYQMGFNSASAATVLAFFAFSACASSVYLVNDMLDLPSDRQHPRKRNRPLASGDLSIKTGSFLAVGMLTLGLTIASAVSAAFTGLVIVYLSLTTLYTVSLKKKVLIDVLTLASLYTLRVIAGGVAAHTVVSEWLLAFSVFLFSSLGFVKRYSELCRLQQENATTAVGRDYHTSDASVVESMGISCGFISVMVFAMYIHSNDVTKIYSITWPLWLVCPLLLYWVGRIWIHAKRGLLCEDPVTFALTDRMSFVTAGTIFVLLLLAKTGPAFLLP